MAENSNLKVAIVCDWLVTVGGAERVLLQLHKLYPEAPIYTSQYRPKKIDWFKEADVRVGWLQRLPFALRKFIPPLRAWYFSHLDLSDYDLVISSSGAEAKSVRTGLGTVHICYMHAPTHYYWSRYDEYMQNPGFGLLNPLARLGLKLFVGPMRRWDKKAAQRPNFIVTNSNHTRDMIKQYYDREAAVIHPPVDIKRFENARHSGEREGFVTAGRQTPYKRFDLAIAACTKLGLPLTVIGNGPDHQRLFSLAGPSINFITDASDQDVAISFAKAEAFIFPGVDDFGVTAIEAMAAGTPVIALKAGGALDYVELGKTGQFFYPQTEAGLINSLKEFDPRTFNNKAIADYARRFSITDFKEQFKDFVSQKLPR